MQPVLEPGTSLSNLLFIDKFLSIPFAQQKAGSAHAAHPRIVAKLRQDLPFEKPLPLQPMRMHVATSRTSHLSYNPTLPARSRLHSSPHKLPYHHKPGLPSERSSMNPPCPILSTSSCRKGGRLRSFPSPQPWGGNSPAHSQMLELSYKTKACAEEIKNGREKNRQ